MSEYVVKTTEFTDLIEIIPPRFSDERGHFCIPFHKKEFHDKGLPYIFMQDNESFSIKGTLRGLHFQKGDFSQGKLVRAITGYVQDVVVDLRPDSSTYRKWKSFYLDPAVGNMVYVPVGFAHGFLALEDSIFSYKCTKPFNKASEGGVHWADPSLSIEWDLNRIKRVPIISKKDQMLPTLD